MGYGNETASDSNVPFAFDLALQAARDLYALSGKVTAHQGSRGTAAGTARTDWIGPKRDTFDEKVAAEDASADAISGSLVSLANDFASQWAMARGEQDRINFARYVDHEISSDGWGENLVETFTGEDDYGPPPEDPPIPEGPDYEPTRSPLHAGFE